jgi:hypothetical protein
MQTAVGVFGGESCSNGVSVPPLMVENAGRPAVSSLNCPPFLAVEACRERLVRTSTSFFFPFFFAEEHTCKVFFFFGLITITARFNAGCPSL